eukprot:11182288-Karenia_brevis.AAC.1
MDENLALELEKDDSSSQPGSESDAEQVNDEDLSQDLLSILTKEKEEFRQSLDCRAAYGQHRGDNYPCPLEPFRAFQSRARLRAHLDSDHAKPHCCTSSKQLQALKSLWSERCASKCADKFVSQTPKGVDTSGLLKE